ncbi:CRISPR-associated helicase Cas3' [Micromonospora sp. NPDC050417]|uniref:CRISPR-associated helicase Cas3' n=1 Tax=Micromonospora sp. NPDC050417 TaxID=3364280 RepID=UPI0037963E1C
MADAVPLWAHSPAPGSNQWHGLVEHLRGTAELARRFAAPFGGGDVAYWLGALHDVGKAACGWQDKLTTVANTGAPVGIDHKSLGTRIAAERGLGGFANGIFGHHGGLVDGPLLLGALKKRLVDNAANVASAEAVLAQLLPDLPADLAPFIPAVWLREPLVGEMALRLCYSALVDADSLDTSAHFRRLPGPQVRPDADFDRLYKLFEQRRGEELAGRGSSPIAALRDRVYAECLAAAEREPGVFRLGAPTGAGKTLASGGFALRHAALHGKRRVIVAVPFLTITEQNAAVYRRLLDEDGTEPAVLEHHSQANFDDDVARRWARLAAENWDAPFVVTTFVRLFESLYARKPAAMRRVHRLANAVIVLDEVQALPHPMLAPILDGLRLLVEHFGATVLLSSATQPSFWALEEFKGVRQVDLIQDTPKLVSELRRVRFEWQVTEPKPTLAEIATQAAAEPAALVVVNTTANAKVVFDCWRDTEPESAAWHLSTRMCPAHRQHVLAQVRQRLKRGERVLLVSTQLVEAGVDVDFPVVFRAMAPADSLLQAAGRANREGLLPQGGRVVIFAPADGGQPPTYKTLVGCAGQHFGPDKDDPDDLAALGRYYCDVYDALNLADVGQVGQAIQKARGRWEFETVSDGPVIDPVSKKRDRKRAFRMIDDEGISVVTPQGALAPEKHRELEQVIEELRSAPVPDMAKLRLLQPYTTNVHKSALRNLGVGALMKPMLGTDVRPGALVEWCGRYDPDTGIDFDPCLEDFVL